MIFKGFLFANGYLDDVLIFSASLREHLEHINKAITKVAGHGSEIKVYKCDFAKE